MSTGAYGPERDFLGEVPRIVESVTEGGTRLQMNFGEVGNFLLSGDDRVALEDLMEVFGGILEGVATNEEALLMNGERRLTVFALIESDLNRSESEIHELLEVDTENLPPRGEVGRFGTNGIAYRSDGVDFTVRFHDGVDGLWDIEGAAMAVLAGSFAHLIATITKETDDPADAFHYFQSDLEELRDRLAEIYELGQLRLN